MAERQHPDEPDVDAIFESIVARWDEGVPDEDLPARAVDPGPLAPPAPRPRQSTGDVRDALPAAREPDPRNHDVPWRVDPTHSVADALLGSDDDPGSADDDEGFVPPTPEPLPPPTDRLFWGALLGLVLGVVGLIWLVVARPDVGGWMTALVLAMIFGGFVCLVVRQPQDRDDDPSNGARI